MAYRNQQSRDLIGKALAPSCLRLMNLQLVPTPILRHMEVKQYQSYFMSEENVALTPLKIEDYIQKCFGWAIDELGRKSQIITSLELVADSKILKRRNLTIL